MKEWNESGNLDLPTRRPVTRLLIDVAFRRWGRNDIPEYEIKNFRQKFFESQRVSIDAFAQRNPYYELMAKIAVAAIILLCERDERLEGDWYQQLIEAIFRHEAGFMARGLKIISFNYDRSFERCMSLALKANYPEGSLGVRSYERISIQHPYGSMGELRDFHYGRLGGESLAVKSLTLARGAANTEQGWGKEFLADVSSVTFLGFSFWPENIDVLKLSALPDGIPVQATAYRLPLPVKDDMRKLIPSIVFGEPNESALDFVVARRVFGFQPD